MKLSLHIGTEKSGTTTIQEFLRLNHQVLRQAGVYIPKTLGPSNHRKLPAMFANDTVLDDFFRHQGLLEKADRVTEKQRWRAEFRAEMRSHQCNHVVISSEHLQSRLTKAEDIAKLAAYLSEIFEKINVYVYMRNPLETAVSLYSTALKSGGVLPDVPPPANPYWNNIVNHKQTLLRWQANFSNARIVPRLFQVSDFVNGDLIQDFIAAVGLPPDAPYQQPARANESLNLVGIELLRRINHAVPEFLPNGQANSQRDLIRKHFSKHFNQGRKFLPKPETVTAYQETFAESDEWVRQTFFPNRTHLFTPKTYTTTTKDTLNAQELDQVADMIASICMQNT